jgi:hypothetical protein
MLDLLAAVVISILVGAFVVRVGLGKNAGRMGVVANLGLALVFSAVSLEALYSFGVFAGDSRMLTAAAVANGIGLICVLVGLLTRFHATSTNQRTLVSTLAVALAFGFSLVSRMLPPSFGGWFFAGLVIFSGSLCAFVYYRHRRKRSTEHSGSPTHQS